MKKKQTKEEKHLAVALSFRGFETIGAQEVLHVISEKATTEKGLVFFSATQKQLVKLSYLTQTLRGVHQIVTQGTFAGSLSSLQQTLSSLLVKKDLSFLRDKTFKVVCDRSGNHDFSSQDAAALAGECILQHEKKTTVSLTNPLYIISLLIQENTFYFGIDFTGIDLSKREYRIYSQQNALNAAFAANVALYAGYTLKTVFVDPSCGIGLLCLEAGLYATGTSPRFYQKDIFAFQKFLPSDLSCYDPKTISKAISISGFDVHLRHVEAAKKHAKLAGIAKSVSFARADIEWIDTKVDEKSVDLIITFVPSEGPSHTEKDIETFFKEFFYQLEFVLKDSGKMVLLCHKTTTLKRVLDYFKIIEEHVAWQGELPLTILTLKKK